MYELKIFSPRWRSVCHRTRVLILMKANVSIFVSMDHAFGVSLYHSESNHERNYTAF